MIARYESCMRASVQAEGKPRSTICLAVSKEGDTIRPNGPLGISNMTIVEKAIAKWKSEGMAGLARSLGGRVVGFISGLPRVRKLRCYGDLRRLFEGKTGLEIGGPSMHFMKNGLFPV